MSDRTAGAPYFRLFAEHARRGLSPLYEILALAIAGDPQMLALAAQARPGQPQANILFAAVHALMLSGVEHALANYFPSCGGKRAATEGDVYQVFSDFVGRNRDALLPVIRTRVTNTNEVGRSALIYPAFDVIASETESPLRIIEIGPSAGFNLNWHRYGYRYTDELNTPLIDRNPSSTLVLSSQLKGSKRPKLASAMPAVEAAIGLELNPVDPAREEDRLWLRALVWPERLDRLAKMDAALAIASAHPVRIVSGNASTDLPAQLEGMGGSDICIVHTHVLYQFDVPALERFEALLFEASETRPIHRVSIEFDGTDYPVKILRYEKSNRFERTLATCDPHGGWLEWLEN